MKPDIRFGFSETVYFPSDRNEKKQLKHNYLSGGGDHLSSVGFKKNLDRNSLAPYGVLSRLSPIIKSHIHFTMMLRIEMKTVKQMIDGISLFHMMKCDEWITQSLRVKAFNCAAW